MSDEVFPMDDNFCAVCAEHHETPAQARSHEKAAKEYEEKYGVSI